MTFLCSHLVFTLVNTARTSYSTLDLYVFGYTIWTLDFIYLICRLSYTSAAIFVVIG